MENSTIVPLHTVPKGQRVRVVEVPEGKSRAQLIRLGILTGEQMTCLNRLPGGTMLIEKNRQEIAIGFALACTILVSYVAESI
jgi:ferrous iron transport protein A